MKSSLLLLSSILYSFIQWTTPFTPTTPPRFDDAMEHLVGTWSDPKTGVVYGTVEEVMRSCGGAIQGMREVPILSSFHTSGAAVTSTSTTTTSSNSHSHSSADNVQSSLLESMKPYHNRADDGFIFFDCGSYTQGPVYYHDTTNKDNEDKDNDFISTLVFRSIPKRRMLIQTFPSSTTTTTTTTTATLKTVYMNMTRKKVHHDQQKNMVDQVLDDDVQHDTERKCRNISFVWKNHIVCRMPTEGQAWMLNRAKWLKLDHVSTQEQPIEVSFDVSATFNDNKDDPNEMIGWTKCIDGQDLDDMNSNHELSSLLDFNHLQDIILPCSHIIQTGAYCEERQEIKAILRIYNNQNQLKSVILQQGFCLKFVD